MLRCKKRMAALLHSFKITHLFGIISLLKRGRGLYGLKGHITQIRRTFSHPPTQLLKENYLPQKNFIPCQQSSWQTMNMAYGKRVASKLMGWEGGPAPWVSASTFVGLSICNRWVETSPLDRGIVGFVQGAEICSIQELWDGARRYGVSASGGQEEPFSRLTLAVWWVITT